MNKLRIIMLSLTITFTICLLSAKPLLALREVAPTVGTNLTQTINQEKELQKQIVAEKKLAPHARASKPMPKSLSMPTKEELAAKAALKGGKIPAAGAFSEEIKKNQQDIQTTTMAKESRDKAFKEEEIGNTPVYIWAGVILVLLLIAGIVFLFKKAYEKKEDGNAIVFSIVIIMIIFIIGASLVFLSENETNKSVQSNKQNAALYIADGGIEKAIWELNHNTDYSGESNILLGNGKFTVTVSTPAGLPNQRALVSTGQIGLSRRKIKALIEKIPGSISVNSALACGGNVNMGGNASVNGGTITGVLVPVGCSVSTVGASTITGTPATGNAPFPVFEDVFGMTMAQMKGYATNKYTNPGTNPACNGITWIDGELKTNSFWHGTGVLIVNGDFDMTGGGTFTGVVYVIGAFFMAGHAQIQGAVLSQSLADITGIFGTADLYYSDTAVDQANNVYPFKILTWQEVKN